MRGIEKVVQYEYPNLEGVTVSLFLFTPLPETPHAVFTVQCGDLRHTWRVNLSGALLSQLQTLTTQAVDNHLAALGFSEVTLPD